MCRKLALCLFVCLFFAATAAAQRQRSAIVETLRLETLRVAPRATPSAARPSTPAQPRTGSATANGSRKGTTPTGF